MILVGGIYDDRFLIKPETTRLSFGIEGVSISITGLEKVSAVI